MPRLIFSAGYLVSYLSAITGLLPGHIIFTGTPAGAGMPRTPPRYLRPGDEVVSHIEGIGTIGRTWSPRAEPCGRTAGRNSSRPAAEQSIH